MELSVQKLLKRRKPKLSFEENLAELSKIVESLEKGDLSLEKSVELYEKGMQISEDCKKELDSAKLKITEH